jgi:4-hydroxyphenylpyruvate dioxygenase
MLEIGPNYYEDLEACFGLDPELVARMARFNILYDRDGPEEGGAEYFQFYSRAVAKRVFLRWSSGVVTTAMAPSTPRSG